MHPHTDTLDLKESFTDTLDVIESFTESCDVSGRLWLVATSKLVWRMAIQSGGLRITWRKMNTRFLLWLSCGLTQVVNCVHFVYASDWWWWSRMGCSMLACILWQGYEYLLVSLECSWSIQTENHHTGWLRALEEEDGWEEAAGLAVLVACWWSEWICWIIHQPSLCLLQRQRLMLSQPGQRHLRLLLRPLLEFQLVLHLQSWLVALSHLKLHHQVMWQRLLQYLVKVQLHQHLHLEAGVMRSSWTIAGKLGWWPWSVQWIWICLQGFSTCAPSLLATVIIDWCPSELLIDFSLMSE